MPSQKSERCRRQAERVACSAFHRNVCGLLCNFTALHRKQIVHFILTADKTTNRIVYFFCRFTREPNVWCPDINVVASVYCAAAVSWVQNSGCVCIFRYTVPLQSGCMRCFVSHDICFHVSEIEKCVTRTTRWYLQGAGVGWPVEFSPHPPYNFRFVVLFALRSPRCSLGLFSSCFPRDV
jgi:hypothetical protein